MSELETKVAAAIWEARRAPEQSPWAELHPSVRDGVLTGARAAIAVMREHSGGGYEAAARECERLAGDAKEAGAQARCASEQHGLGERARALTDAARIIREHAQHVPDTEWVALVAERDGLRAEVEALTAKWRERDEGCTHLAKELTHAIVARGAADDELRDCHDQLAAATKRAEGAERELGDAWSATGVASTVRGLTTLADVIATRREQCTAAEARVRELEQRAEGADRDCAALREGLAKAHAQYDASHARVRELEAAQRSDDRDYQRVVEERDRAEARLGEMAARPVVDAAARKALLKLIGLLSERDPRAQEVASDLRDLAERIGEGEA